MNPFSNSLSGVFSGIVRYCAARDVNEKSSTKTANKTSVLGLSFEMDEPTVIKKIISECKSNGCMLRDHLEYSSIFK